MIEQGDLLINIWMHMTKNNKESPMNFEFFPTITYHMCKKVILTTWTKPKKQYPNRWSNNTKVSLPTSTLCPTTLVTMELTKCTWFVTCSTHYKQISPPLSAAITPPYILPIKHSWLTFVASLSSTPPNFLCVLTLLSLITQQHHNSWVLRCQRGQWGWRARTRMARNETLLEIEGLLQNG